jgi:hypothetical protein
MRRWLEAIHRFVSDFGELRRWRLVDNISPVIPVGLFGEFR